MKRYISFLLIFSMLISLVFCACSSSKDEETTENPSLTQARKDVIDKWAYNKYDEKTPQYIEDIYNQFSDDSVISNIYFCCKAMEEFDKFDTDDNDTKQHLLSAVEYAKKIDTTYSNSFYEEILNDREIIMDKYYRVFGQEDKFQSVTSVEETEKENKPYSQLTDSDKREINNFIKDRYKYYDLMNGHNTGDQYSNKIWHETMEEYGLTSDQVDQIWINGYKY